MNKKPGFLRKVVKLIMKRCERGKSAEADAIAALLFTFVHHLVSPFNDRINRVVFPSHCNTDGNGDLKRLSVMDDAGVLHNGTNGVSDDHHVL